eukprot:gene4011-20178_t
MELPRMNHHKRIHYSVIVKELVDCKDLKEFKEHYNRIEKKLLLPFAEWLKESKGCSRPLKETFKGCVLKPVRVRAVLVKRHVKCNSHVDNCLNLAFFGHSNIAEQLSHAYRASVQEHNLKVDKNRHVLSKIIYCVKFCGAFELALRAHDETDDSRCFSWMYVNFAAALDSVLSQHLETATVFKGTSKTIQNELLDIMYKIAQEQIQKEIREAKFVAIISDDKTDVSSFMQNVVVLRYVVSGKL